MIKLLLPLLNLLVMLIFQVFQGGVTVNMDVPAQVNAGAEFEVRIVLSKGDLESFSRFQQDIPAGLSAISETSANADFTFDDNRVRLIWFRMPRNDEVSVSYRVKVDERLKGTFNLSGQFSYIENNERKSVEIEPVAISINPSPNIDPALIVDINDFDQRTIPYIRPFEAASTAIACIRQQPVADTDGTYIVHLLVNKNDKQQFAKIEEEIPAGYTAASIDPKGGIFTFTDQVVKFLWMNMPMDAYFTVSYRLIPRNQAVLPPPSLEGTFSFLSDEKTLTVDIMERDADLLALSRDEIFMLVSQSEDSMVDEQETDEALVADQSQSIDEEDEVQTANREDETQTDLQSSQTDSAVSPVSPAITPSITAVAASLLLQPEEGIYYRIQLAAGHEPVNVTRYFRNLKIERDVKMEEHNGWNKYSIGSFEEYREARDYRVHIWNTTPVKDAFVTAYHNGNRITVQEAIMISDQKWYQ